MENIKITLSNGTELTGLELNGNNFISSTKVTEDTFAYGLTGVQIQIGDTVEEHEEMELVQILKIEGRYWFVLRDLTAQELVNKKTKSDIEYLAMMSDVELD